MSPFCIVLLVLQHTLQASANVLSGQRNCNCGFVDGQTNHFFTDSIIVYFNETESLPTEFLAEDYTHTYEQDWNAIYRQGADPANVRFNESESLQLVVQPSTKDHVVQGGGLRTTRRDIQHGSFRTLIRSPRQTFSGSAMSMMLQYNESETTELSVMNMNNHSDAWVGTFVNNEFTTRDLGVNYTQLIGLPAANRNYTTLGGGLNNGSIDPWDYTEYRIDWTKDYISFYIGGNLTRQVLHKDNEGMPSVPSTFILKHWSTGNRYSMRGPPRRESAASVGWVRLFFNTTSISTDSREDFVAKCPLIDACSMDDELLRGSTPYVDAAMTTWKQKTHKSLRRMPALWVSIACLAFSTILVVHALIRRLRQPKVTGHGVSGSSSGSPASLSNDENDSSDDSFAEKNPFEAKEYMLESSKTSLHSNPFISRPPSSKCDSVDDLAIEMMEPSPSTSELGGSTPYGPSRQNSVMFNSGATTRVPSLYKESYNNTREELYLPSNSAFKFPAVPGYPSELTLTGASRAPGPEDKIQMETVTEPALPAPRMRPQPAPQRQRIDHLAGLTALCALFVTVMHFGLTFVPAIVTPGAPQHARSEYWAQKIIAPFILNQMWLGVFFTTSVRFLTAPYLRKGNVEELAKAAVRRTPRLMIPVASIALLEYFLIDIGATKYLRYIPSLTWSTWPYVARYDNFGQYISEILELTYLIPNAVPQITLHYCTGVLWTIAVQLQGSWLVLLGALIVREIKSSWKRVCFYTFCLVNHWYANSWGTYLWLGLLLTDLDVTYSYKKYLHARPLAYYPLITVCWLCVAAGFAVNIIPNWTDTTFNFATSEHDIHPDFSTGEPTLNTENSGYPAYYTPRLNGLLFAGGMQAVVELSSAVQWLLSTPPLLVLFPHIFTIYLLHGLVFWTWGSWLLVFLSDRGFSYNIAVAIVGVTSYAVLALCLPIVTPILEALGKDITALVWMTAKEKSPPRRATLFPFPQDLFTSREVNKAEAEQGDVDVEAGKGKTCGLDRRSSSDHDENLDRVKGKEKVLESKLDRLGSDDATERGVAAAKQTRFVEG